MLQIYWYPFLIESQNVGTIQTVPSDLRLILWIFQFSESCHACNLLCWRRYLTGSVLKLPLNGCINNTSIVFFYLPWQSVQTIHNSTYTLLSYPFFFLLYLPPCILGKMPFKWNIIIQKFDSMSVMNSFQKSGISSISTSETSPHFAHLTW